MKTKLLSLFALLFTFFSYGQINFERGYFIGKDDVKQECLIKNKDERFNPTEFVYKIDEAGETRTFGAAAVKEFGIYGVVTYVSRNVLIDRSSDWTAELSKERNPVWTQELLFLKVLVQGSASLYSYDGKSLKRFFYVVKDTTVKQLVYRKYMVMSSNNSIAEAAEDNKFRQQLWTDVQCGNVTMDGVKKMEYSAKQLEKFFRNYNLCRGDAPVIITAPPAIKNAETKNSDTKTGTDTKAVSSDSKQKPRKFHLKLTPGLNSAAMSVTSSAMSMSGSFAFPNNSNLRMGLEMEFVMPFNNNKWGVVIEPTYQSFKGEQDFIVFSTPHVVSINYSGLEFPIGIRHYFFLNDKSKIFLNGFVIPGTGTYQNSTIEFNNLPSNTLNLKGKASFSVGGGFAYGVLSLEARYYTKRNMLANYSSWSTDYTRTQIIFGIRIL